MEHKNDINDLKDHLKLVTRRKNNAYYHKLYMDNEVRAYENDMLNMEILIADIEDIDSNDLYRRAPGLRKEYLRREGVKDCSNILWLIKEETNHDEFDCEHCDAIFNAGMYISMAPKYVEMQKKLKEMNESNT